jgi:hypothetical protein
MIAAGTHIRAMKNLELSDEETDALVRLLHRPIDDDHYPLSPRVQERDPGQAEAGTGRPAAAPAPRVYAPPSRGRYRRRG